MYEWRTLGPSPWAAESPPDQACEGLSLCLTQSKGLGNGCFWSMSEEGVLFCVWVQCRDFLSMLVLHAQKISQLGDLRVDSECSNACLHVTKY